jgi:hypothetical protein
MKKSTFFFIEICFFLYIQLLSLSQQVELSSNKNCSLPQGCEYMGLSEINEIIWSMGEIITGGNKLNKMHYIFCNSFLPTFQLEKSMHSTCDY